MSSSHISKNMRKLLDELKRRGFQIIREGNCIRIIPPSSIKIPMYIAHYGEKGYHPVRRYVKNQCGMEIKE